MDGWAASDQIEIVILTCLETRENYDFDPIRHSEMQPWSDMQQYLNVGVTWMSLCSLLQPVFFLGQFMLYFLTII